MSHSSWFIYASMMRIYKHYHLNLDDVSLAARSISFSSYPGMNSCNVFTDLSCAKYGLLYPSNTCCKKYMTSDKIAKN